MQAGEPPTPDQLLEAVLLAAAVEAELEGQAQACQLQGQLCDQVMALQVR